MKTKISDLSPEAIDGIYSIYREAVGNAGARLLTLSDQSDLDYIQSELQDVQKYLLRKEHVIKNIIKDEEKKKTLS